MNNKHFLSLSTASSFPLPINTIIIRIKHHRRRMGKKGIFGLGGGDRAILPVENSLGGVLVVAEGEGVRER
ncbi:hypothetical protein L2E82_10979 [Cichorium intybus]|uniref:Uncharacterized protein n=1 Tax=Cichorium intybus TaxID=13427 RepID=A0ACB9GBW3_CICIN|nr:hypothetical protein L2E82_10979 [Cichorium intybus]